MFKGFATNQLKIFTEGFFMRIGKLFLSSISSGIITPEEITWIANNQSKFSRCELAKALKIGQLVDSGELTLGCRI